MFNVQKLSGYSHITNKTKHSICLGERRVRIFCIPFQNCWKVCLFYVIIFRLKFMEEAFVFRPDGNRAAFTAIDNTSSSILDVDA